MESEFQLPLSNQDSPLRSRLQLNLIQQFKSLKQSPENLSNFIDFISSIISQTSQTEFKDFSPTSVKNEFTKSFYSLCLTEILTSIHQLDISSNHYVSSQLAKLLTLTNFYNSFSVLYDFITSKKNEIYFYLMKSFVSNHLIQKLLVERVNYLSENKSSNFIEEISIQKLCNLPDKFLSIIEPIVSFKNKKSYTTYFLTNNYFTILIVDLFQCTRFLLEKFNLNENLEGVKYIATLFGKISFNGYSEILFEKFTKNLFILAHSNQNWKQFSKQLFEHIPYKYLESSLLNLIKKSSSYEDLEVIIQDLVVVNSNYKHFLCDKFLFFKIFKQNQFIQTLLGYLYSNEKNRVIYIEICKKLLNSWSNQTSFANTPYEQHLFLTKCILVCYSFLSEDEKVSISQDLTKPLLNGVEKHLHSPFENIRVLGMVVGENLMNQIFKDMEKDDPKKSLKFDYEKTDEILNLIALSKRPNIESIYKKKTEQIEENNFDEICNQIIQEDKIQKDKIIFENKNLNINIHQSGTIDSDDEDKLEAFDVSNDTVKIITKKPIYLRDCLNSLIYSNEPQEIETSLKSVKTLCDTYHTELQEICVELVRVLLSKSNTYSLEDFDNDRMTAMISITCHYPKECADYLTSQFYEAGYSLSQRADILNVLVMTAQKLSDPNVDNFTDKRVFGKNYVNFNQLSEMGFQNVIKKKTPSSLIKKVPPVKKKTKENIFSDSIGYFFFPLLNSYDKGKVYFSLMEKDFQLLGKMIFSLTVILYLSENTQVQENMIKAFADFLWSVKSHSEDFVQKSVIFAYTIIVMVIPEHLLFSYFNNYFVEVKYWLEGIILGDTKTDCKMEAQNCLSLMSNRVKSGLKILSENV